MIGNASVSRKQTPRDIRFAFGKFVFKATPKEQEAFLWVISASAQIANHIRLRFRCPFRVSGRQRHLLTRKWVSNEIGGRHDPFRKVQAIGSGGNPVSLIGNACPFRWWHARRRDIRQPTQCRLHKRIRSPLVSRDVQHLVRRVVKQRNYLPLPPSQFSGTSSKPKITLPGKAFKKSTSFCLLAPESSGFNRESIVVRTRA